MLQAALSVTVSHIASRKEWRWQHVSFDDSLFRRHVQDNNISSLAAGTFSPLSQLEILYDEVANTAKAMHTMWRRRGLEHNDHQQPFMTHQPLQQTLLLPA